MSDVITLIAGGKQYAGWTEMECGRGLQRCASSFEISLTEKWLGATSTKPIQLLPFTPVTVMIGGDTVLTGYVDAYVPAFTAGDHTVKISGRSKTAQLVDCTPDIASGQFRGYSLAAIAAGIAAPFGISTVVQTNLAGAAAGTAGPQNETLIDPGTQQSGRLTDATLERGETAFTFLDRLCTVAGVLLTDDELGRLVLTTAGNTRASGGLTQGVNVQGADATLNGAQRFSSYIVKGQTAVTGTVGYSDELGTTPSVGVVQTAQRAVVNDSGVPLYRPKIIIAESQLSQAQMQLRASWECQYALGRAAKANVTVKGWRQPNGELWKINQIIACNLPFLGLAQDLLSLSVSYRQTLSEGKTTTLTVGPVAGATPNPNLLKRTKKAKKGRGGSGADWDGVQQ